MKKRPRNKQYDKRIVLIIVFFLAGILIGAIVANTMDELEQKELNQYINDTIQNMKSITVYYTEYFFQNYTSQIKVIFIIWIAGFFAYGYFVVYGSIFLKGFMYGFTVAFLTSAYGFNGFTLGFLSYIPHNLVYLPVLYILSKMSILNSFSINNGRGKLNKNILTEYVLLIIVTLAFFGLGSIVETYITPKIVTALITKF